MHKVAPQIAERLTVHLIHIAETTVDALKANGISRVGLLGTKYTMLQDFYKAKIQEAGIDVLIPEAHEIDKVSQVIFDELCLGQIKPDSRAHFQKLIDDFKARGAQGVILGCIEIGLLISQEDTSLPLFDTTQIHALKAVELALADA